MRSHLLNRAFTAMVTASAALVFVLMLWMLGDVLWHGASRLSFSFLLAAPADAGRGGGIGSILVSTVLILAVAVMVALPIGVGAAVWLSEYARRGSRFAKTLRTTFSVLAGVPSIIFGLFGNAFFSLYLGLGFSILSGGLTLACMILPILVNTSDAGLSAVSDDWRRGAAALGMSRCGALGHILLPAAAPAISAGLLLGIGRATAETAALVFTSGYVDRMPGSLFDSGRALAVHIYDLSMNVTGGDASAYASAVVLIALILAVNALALWLSDRWVSRRISHA